jgi:sortase A
VEGASASQLRSGPGHVQGSPIPGERGNSVIVGHRTRYTGPFGRLHELHKGDRIVVQTRRSTTIAYAVDRVTSVSRDSSSPVRATKDTRLTLVTAGPGLSPDRNVVVTATPLEGQPAPIKSTRLVSAPHALTAADLDQRPTSPIVGALAAIALLAVAALAIFVTGRDLRRRYSPLVTFAVIAPVVALLVVLALLLVDVALPVLV